MSDCAPRVLVVEEIVRHALVVRAPDAERNRRRNLTRKVNRSALHRSKRDIQPNGHVPAPDVESDAGNADLLVIGNHTADRLRVAEMAIGANDAGDSIADAHAGLHLRNRAGLVRAQHHQRAVPVGFGLRRKRCGGLRRRAFLIFGARSITKLAPGRHRPEARPLDAGLRIDTRCKCKRARTIFVFVFLSHCRCPK